VVCGQSGPSLRNDAQVVRGEETRMKIDREAAWMWVFALGGLGAMLAVLLYEVLK
jgi:hypothetical protein